MKYLLIILFLSGFHILNGQEALSKGIEYLENGNYDQAVDVLKEVVSEFPDNKTAQICYGRALGLSGTPEKAYDIFENLSSTYPGDYEVGLNKAEAFMWMGKFAQAKDSYSSLSDAENSDFKAFWGMANACFSLEQFETALTYISKAINDEPGLPGIKSSKKYILLGLAGQQRDQWRFDEASQNLDTLLSLFPDDREGLLNLAILHLYEKKITKAFKVYQYIYQEQIDVFEGLLGMSYTSILKGNKKKALDWIELLLQEEDLILSDNKKQRAELQYIDCLLLNEEFDTATTYIQRFKQDHGNIRALELIKARQSLLKAEWRLAEASFSNMVEKYPQSYDVLMGIAEIKKLYGQIEEARNYVEKALVSEPHRPDAKRLLRNIQNEYNAQIYTEAGFFGDNNANSGHRFDIQVKLRNRMGLEPTFKYSHKAVQDMPGQTANNQKWMAGANWTVNPALKLGLNTGFSYTNQTLTGSKKWMWMADAVINYRINNKHNAGLTYRRTLQDYSVSLLSRQLSGHEFGMNYNHKFSDRWNIYGNASINIQSDGNVKNSFYAANYFNVLGNPLLQMGVSFQYLSFKDSGIQEYFSPDRYLVLESYVLLSNMGQSHQKFKYHLFLASGLQDINGERQIRGRFNAKLGYKVHGNLTIFGMYEMNNAIDINPGSYSFREFRLSLQYIF